MPLLVTTTKAFWVFDEISRQAYRIDEGNGVYYGLTHGHDGRIFVGARRCRYGVDLAGRAAQTGTILVFNPDLTTGGELVPPFPLRDLHQLYFFDNKLWACATHDNAIAIYSFPGWELWHPFGKPENPDDPDRHHINSIWADGDEIFLVGHSKTSGCVHVFDRSTRAHKRTLDFGTYAHNVWREDGKLQVLSSLEGCIAGEDGARRPVSPGNFVRGVVATAAHLYVGVSENVNRAEREKGSCEVVKLDRDGRTLNIFGLVGYGMVHDLRCPGVHDIAHQSADGPPVDPMVLSRFPSVPLARRTIPVGGMSGQAAGAARSATLG